MNEEIASPPFGTLASDHEVQSPWSHLLDKLALHGYRPLDDQPDPRPLLSSDAASVALESAIDALSGLLLDIRLEADLPDLLWGPSSIFPSKGRAL